MTAGTFPMKRSNPNELSVRLACKLLAFMLMVALAAAVLLGTMAYAFAGPMPNRQVLVKSADIRLGDVFEGLNQHADFVLAPAPKPGEELVWNEPTLLRIATAFNLPWRPESGDKISIRRAATLVDADTMRAVIRDHLATVNDADSFNITMTTEVPEIVVPGTESPRIEIADFSMPETGGPFSAIIRVAASQGKPETVTLRGMAERLVSVPVLKRTMKNGTIIQAEDLTWVTKSAVNVRRDVISDADEIIGNTPRRGIAGGAFMRHDDLQKPLMISRGDPVTMVHDAGGMYVTAKGRAMEDGTFGQIIKVANMGSNKQIEARVTGSRQVTVK